MNIYCTFLGLLAVIGAPVALFANHLVCVGVL